VTFRGVKVGEVEDVKAFLTGRPRPLIQIEVVIEIQGGVVEVPEGQGVPPAFAKSATREEFAQGLLERGIRARMMSASLLTGQRYIDLDFLPDEKPRFAGLRARYPELPTIPTAMERIGDRAEVFLAKLADLPLDQMLEDVRKALQAAREVLESRDLRQAFAAANRSAGKMEATLDQMHTALHTADEALGALRNETTPTADEARQTLRSLREAASRAEESLDLLKGTLRGTDDTRMTAAQALTEMTHTLRALRNLVDYIQTHPEAFVQGKPPGKEKK
jgi:paraquat-inducible protein B